MRGSGQSKGYSAEHVANEVAQARDKANADAERAQLQRETEFRFAQQKQQAEAQLAQQQAAQRADLAEASAQDAKRAQAAQQDERFQSVVQETRESKGEEMAELGRELAPLQDQMSTDAEELKDRKDMGKLEEVQKTRFNSFLSYVRPVVGPPKTQKPPIAILGNRGVGKSSTCNGLIDEEFAKTGCEDTTMLITQVYDVPGETDTRSYSNLEHLNWSLLAGYP